MANQNVTANRHPVDALADVRAQIKVLAEQETALKEIVSKMMGSNDAIEGEDFIATQSVSERKGGIDEKALKAAGINVDDYRKANVSVYTLKVCVRTARAA